MCRYRAALDAALATEQVEIVANLLEELAARSGLGAALGEGLSPGVPYITAIPEKLPAAARWCLLSLWNEFFLLSGAMASLRSVALGMSGVSMHLQRCCHSSTNHRAEGSLTEMLSQQHRPPCKRL